MTNFAVEPTTQIFPDVSRVAVVAISSAPVSSDKDHCVAPSPSIVRTNPSVPCSPLTVPKDR